MRESFKTMLTPIMKELDARIRQEGVSEVLKNDSLLRELNSLESKPNSLSSDGPSGGHGHTDSSTEYKDLQKELQEDPKTAIEKNLNIFTRKFEMQKKEIVEEINKLVVRESDRVIESVLAGPHEKILDRVCCSLGRPRMALTACLIYEATVYDLEGHGRPPIIVVMVFSFLSVSLRVGVETSKRGTSSLPYVIFSTNNWRRERLEKRRRTFLQANQTKTRVREE